MNSHGRYSTLSTIKAEMPDLIPFPGSFADLRGTESKTYQSAAPRPSLEALAGRFLPGSHCCSVVPMLLDIADIPMCLWQSTAPGKDSGKVIFITTGHSALAHQCHIWFCSLVVTVNNPESFWFMSWSQGGLLCGLQLRILKDSENLKWILLLIRTATRWLAFPSM